MSQIQQQGARVAQFDGGISFIGSCLKEARQTMRARKAVRKRSAYHIQKADLRGGNIRDKTASLALAAQEEHSDGKHRHHH
jgi:hypothetical protein